MTAKEHAHGNIILHGFIKNTTNIDIPPSYHSYWSWTMRIVDKIESLGYSTAIGYNLETKTHYAAIFAGKEFQRKVIKNIEGEVGQSKIEVVWTLCVKFIEWHNRKKANEQIEKTVNN